MHSKNQQYHITMRLFGLFIKCPFSEAAHDCPFGDIRSRESLDLKFRLAERIARHPHCFENVRNTHEACYRARIQQVIRSCRAIPIPSSATQQTTSLLYEQAAIGQ
ncbi:MAG: hypothetical protein A2512_01610 [Deltaproteobacteria bacterium RIFOXYD12_FULL_56_24]|nr:MAG: hypothetical protein A2512_01610 [Deltaproteobacteria bacterium RIFOXYD12_FULL_56_24]